MAFSKLHAAIAALGIVAVGTPIAFFAINRDKSKATVWKSLKKDTAKFKRLQKEMCGIGTTSPGREWKEETQTCENKTTTSS